MGLLRVGDTETERRGDAMGDLLSPTGTMGEEGEREEEGKGELTKGVTAKGEGVGE